MRELFQKQADLFNQHNILICYFSFKDKETTRFRIYFKDLTNAYLGNRLEPIPKSDGSVSYSYLSYSSLAEALESIFAEIEEYLKTKSPHINDSTAKGVCI